MAINEEDLARLGAAYGLSYHVPMAAAADKAIGLAGKRILEVGGSLPEGFVRGELGTATWTAVEELDYWHESQVQGLSSGTPPTKVPARRLAGIADPATLGSYEVLAGAVEELPAGFDGHFDAVFSIAAFEHIAHFPAALDAMFRALKPGGLLFAQFSPIWSAHDGHHLPTMKDDAGRVFDFHNSPVPYWGHLLMRPAQLYDHIVKSVDPATADRIVYYVYHSPHINRLFTEDYVAYFRRSAFRIAALSRVATVKVPEKAQKELQRLHPGRKHFGNNGLRVVLEKADPAAA